MATDEEKTKTVKLLRGLEVHEMKLSERCSDLLKDFHQKFDKEIEEEEQAEPTHDVYENPYRVDQRLLEENERKLRELLSECKSAKKEFSDSVVLSGADPKRPWRTHSNKEKLLRIDTELKRHTEKASEMIVPMSDDEMKDLIQECKQETCGSSSVAFDRLRETVDAAKKNLPNFQYRNIDNTTATNILQDAHEINATVPQKT